MCCRLISFRVSVCVIPHHAQTVDAVANMLLMYKQSLVVHEWLKLK